MLKKLLWLDTRNYIVFIEELPRRFYKNVGGEYKIKLMQLDEKGIRIGEFKVYNTEDI